MHGSANQVQASIQRQWAARSTARPASVQHNSFGTPWWNVRTFSKQSTRHHGRRLCAPCVFSRLRRQTRKPRSPDHFLPATVVLHLMSFWWTPRTLHPTGTLCPSLEQAPMWLLEVLASRSDSDSTPAFYFWTFGRSGLARCVHCSGATVAVHSDPEWPGLRLDCHQPATLNSCSAPPVSTPNISLRVLGLTLGSNCADCSSLQS